MSAVTNSIMDACRNLVGRSATVFYMTPIGAFKEKRVRVLEVEGSRVLCEYEEKTFRKVSSTLTQWYDLEDDDIDIRPI